MKYWWNEFPWRLICSQPKTHSGVAFWSERSKLWGAEITSLDKATYVNTVFPQKAQPGAAVKDALSYESASNLNEKASWIKTLNPDAIFFEYGSFKSRTGGIRLQIFVASPLLFLCFSLSKKNELWMLHETLRAHRQKARCQKSLKEHALAFNVNKLCYDW